MGQDYEEYFRHRDKNMGQKVDYEEYWRQKDEEMRKHTAFIAKCTKYAIAGCILFLLFLSSFYTVEQGERAIVLRLGKIVDVTNPGINFKVPVIDRIKCISVRTHKITLDTEVYSSDIQGASIKISMNYSIAPNRVADVYSKYYTDYENRIIIPQIMARAKDVFGKRQANDIVKNRLELMDEIKNSLFNYFENEGILPESIQLEEIDFSKEFEQRIEQRMQAEIDVATRKQQLEQTKIQAQMVEAEAEGIANKRVIEADGEAKAINVIADAEAHKVKVIADAMNTNPKYVDFVEANKWDGVLPNTIMSGSANVIPVLK